MVVTCASVRFAGDMMDVHPETATIIPGARIGGYRNSSPRRIRLLGLGREAGKVVREIGQRNLSNVEIAADTRPVGWADIVEGRAGTPINMAVIVCAEGDERLFRPE